MLYLLAYLAFFRYCNQSLSAKGAMRNYLVGQHEHAGCEECPRDSLYIRLLAINHHYQRMKEAAER